MALAFFPGLLDGLFKLPVVKARAEAGGHRLSFFSAVVVAEAVVGQPQRFGEHPAFAIVLFEEGLVGLSS